MHQSIDVVFGVVGDVQYSHLWPQGAEKEIFYENPKEMQETFHQARSISMCTKLLAVRPAFDVLLRLENSVAGSASTSAVT
jgi:hypothetical protein